MPIRIRAKSFFYSLAFFTALELVSKYDSWLFWVWLIMAAAFLFQKWHFFLGSCLFLLSTMVYTLIFPKGFETQILIILSTVAFYLYLTQQSRRSVFALMSFLVISGVMGITTKYLTFVLPTYLPGFANWWFFFTIFTAVFILTYVGLRNSLEAHGFSSVSAEGETSAKGLWRDALFSGLMMGQLAIAVNFLPLNFLTESAIIWIVYLVVHDFLKNELYLKLTKKIVLRDLIIAGLLLAVILATVPWQLI